MSAQNQISIEIPATVIAEVTQKIQECRTALAPFLQGLTAEERIAMFKMGNKTVATVQKTKQYLISNPEFAPVYMNKPEFLKDEAVVSQLVPIVNLATQLATDLDDTVMLAGSEALMAAPCSIMEPSKKPKPKEFRQQNQSMRISKPVLQKGQELLHQLFKFELLMKLKVPFRDFFLVL